MKRNLDVKKVGKFIENSPIIDKYYTDIRKYKQMSKECEKEVFTRLKNGDEKAREEIIKSNLKFVVSVAKKYVRRDEDLLDYINEGNIGLMEAIENFDPEKGFKFITFAVHYIEKRINEYKIDQPIVAKTNLHKTIYLLNKIKSDFLQKELREPTPSEIIDILRTEHETQIFNERDVYNLNVTSLDVLEEDSSDTDNFQFINEFHNRYYCENDIEKAIEKEYNIDNIEKLFHILKPIEKYIIKLHFGIGAYKTHTIIEIAEQTGYVPERIRQIIESSIELMRAYYYIKKEKTGS
jgi:RNA polymerase primary sigma factor